MALLLLVVATLVLPLRSEYIPPGPAYPCPKDNKNLLHPCVCEQGSDAGLYVKCENTGLAILSVGLGNLAGLGQPIERLEIKEGRFSHLFGPLLHRSTIRVIHIVDTPISTIDMYAFAGVNRTLQELRFTNTKMVEFPKDAFKILGNLSILSIDGHQITTLGKDIFAGSEAAGRLEKLHIVNGLISDVPVEAFQNLKKLKTLDLHGNQLVTLKRNQFKGLRDTEMLDLSYNKIQKLDGSHIGDMTKLGFCNISHNQISDMPRGMFARNTVLKVIHLDNNKLKKLDTNSFRGMRFLRRLYLQDNQISDVGRGTFSAVTRIGTIDLARNRLAKVDFQMFQQVRYAELINLAENNITLIESQAFTDLYLAVVNISHNALANIEAGAFRNCNNMTVLDLSHNQLSDINKEAFDENSYAAELQVSYNNFTDFGQVPIQNMSGIQVVNASHNRIERIPRMAFPKLYSLHTVDLSHNNLTEIFNAVFQTLFSLRFLNLSHNSLEVIKPATFGTLPTVLSLDLSHNYLRDVSRGSLAKLASCRTLDVSHNRLEKIFQIPISLGELNLSNNNISEIRALTWPSMNALLRVDLSNNSLGDNLSSASFSGLLTLQALGLARNGLTRPPWEALNALSSLQYLYLQSASFSALTWPSMNALLRVDLSNNSLGDNLSSASFSGLLTLQALGLARNGLTRPPWEALNALSSLQYLYLQDNNLTSLSRSSFGNLPTLFKMELSRNQISSVEQNAFKGLQQLLDLSLSENQLEHIPNEAFKGLVALRLRLLGTAYPKPEEYRHLRPKDIITLMHLMLREKLDLSHNMLEKIDNKTNGLLDDCLSLESVNLSHNRIGFLTKKMFPYSPWIPYRLSEVDLSHNEIPVLTFDLTIGTSKVTKLNLAGNILNDIRSHVLGNLTSLEVLDLSNNNLESLISRNAMGKFALPPRIGTLLLANNSLGTLPAEALARAADLKHLDVRHNRLPTLPVELVREIKKRGLTVLYEGNGLQCDCFIRPLKHYLSHLPSSHLTSIIYNLTCTEPPTLSDESLASVDEERLLCTGGVVADAKLLEYAEGESGFEFGSEPDLVFRDIQYSQEGIYAHWYVSSIDDIADFYLYVRDDKNTLLYNQDISYNLRSKTITIDGEFKKALQNGGRFDICIQAKTSNGAPRRWFDSQCQIIPPNFDSWARKLNIDKRRLTKKRTRSGWFQRNSVLGLVSDSILITLCIFLGVCLKMTDLVN